MRGMKGKFFSSLALGFSLTVITIPVQGKYALPINISQNKLDIVNVGGQSSLKLLKSYQAHGLTGESIIQIHYSQDGQYLLSTATDGLAKLWTEDGELIRIFQGQPWAMIFNGRLSPNSDQIVTAGYNGVARIWNIQGNVLAEIKGHTSAVTDTFFLGEQGGIVTSSDDGSTKGWTITPPTMKERFMTIGQGVTRNMDYSPQARLIATTQDLGSITLLKPSGEIVRRIETGQGRLNDVVFSPDGQSLVSAGFDGTAKIFDLEGRQLLIVSVLASGWVTGVALNNQGLLVTVSDDGILRLWNNQGQLLDDYAPNLGRISSVSFHPSGNKLAIATYHGTILLLEIAN